MKVPATVPYFSEDDIAFITEHFKEILRGKAFLSMHKYGAAFEEQFASYIGTKYAVACNSGTSALELILRALQVEGKEVILPSNTFLATAIAIRNAGAKPVFADCTENLCLAAEDVRKSITEKTAAIIPVHIGGLVSRSILELQKICAEKKLHLVEDACQAHGSSLNGIRAGAFGIGSGFSFFSTKVITTGEGGMVTTNDLNLARKMKSLREFGKIHHGIYINYHTEFGYNWRMPEVAALMGLRQLGAIDRFIEKRKAIAHIYNEELEGVRGIRVVRPEENSVHNYFKYIVLLTEKDREGVHKALEAAEIQPSGYVYEIPLHKLPVFPDDNALTLPTTESVCARHICLPIFYGMREDQAVYVAKTLKKILE